MCHFCWHIKWHIKIQRHKKTPAGRQLLPTDVSMSVITFPFPERLRIAFLPVTGFGTSILIAVLLTHRLGKPFIQPFKLGLFQVLCHIRIDVQRRGNICMSQGVLDYFHIYTGFAHPGRKSMPQGMAAEMREQYLGVRVLAQYCIITVPGNPADRFIQSGLVLKHSKAIDENEIRVPVYPNKAFGAFLFLPPLLLQKRLFYEIQHRDRPPAGLGFRSMNIEIAAIHFMLIIDQRMVHMDQPILQVNIAPAKT